MITVEQAKRLQHGDILHHVTLTNSDGTPQRFRVNSMVKLWKRQPNRVEFAVKRGLYENYRLTNNDLSQFDLA